MAASRLDQLLQFYKDEPNDPFNLYALALEYQKTDTGKSLELFNRLIVENPNYIPTYYHFGKLLQERGDTGDAKAIFEDGIKRANAQNEPKALRELRAALQELEDEDL